MKCCPPVVGQLVHETVEQRGRALVVHPELSAVGEVVALPDVVRVLALRDTNHPQKLVNVISGVSAKGISLLFI